MPAVNEDPGDLRELEQPSGVSPARKGSRHVGAEDDGQAGIRKLFMYLLQRIDRVGRPSPAHLDIARAYTLQALHGELAHLEACVWGGSATLPPLVGRGMHRHEQHSIELQLLQRPFCELQMPAVWRIEGAPEDADPSRACQSGDSAAARTMMLSS